MKTWLSAALGAAVLLALPAVSFAGKGGSGHSSGGHSSGGHSGGNGGHYGGGYYGGGLYLGLGFGYPSYGYGGYAAPSYYPPSTSYYYSPPAYPTPPAAPLMPPAEPTNAVIEVRVPADAQIWFDGDRTSQTGGLRSFETPTVPLGKAFTYDVRARWTNPDGQVVDLTRSVQFKAGQRITLDFLRP